MIVNPGNAGALARGLGRLIDDSALRQALGQRAAQRVEACFSLSSVGQQLRAFISSSVRARAASTGLSVDRANGVVGHPCPERFFR
jgi:glycosyltransferase involved in cell wall biosynthesis